MNWRRFLQRETEDAEQREELESYVDLTAEEYVARGMTPAEAHAAAQRKLGNTTLIREEVYRMNTLTVMESSWRDVLHALRTIRARPSFSVPALLSLALGIGANIAIFTVVNGILIRPLPYPEPEALIGVYNSSVWQGQAFHDMPLSLTMFDTCRKSARTFQDFGVWTEGSATVNGTGDPEQVATVTMTAGVLSTLGVPPYLGRWFSPDDENPGGQQTVILSYAYWQRRFGGDGQVIGRMVSVDLIPRQVIGVMPRKFQFLDLAPDVLLPQPLGTITAQGDEFNHSGIARLKPGVTVGQANQDMARMLGIWADGFGVRQMASQLQIKPEIRPLKQDVVGDTRAVLGILMGAVSLVLLLVCANVANLVLVRAQARRQEFAIRTALGAGWGRIARELLAECVTVGGLGGAMGLGLAYVGLQLLVTSSSTTLPRLSEISIGPASLMFALACSVGSSILFGCIALLKSGRLTMDNARGSSPAFDQLRTANALVVAQVGLALVLLIASGLMIRSFLALRGVTPGFTHPEEIQTVRIWIPPAQVREPERVAQMQADILSRLSAIPGVSVAAFASALPLESEYHNGNVVAVEGKTAADRIPPNRTTKQISPGLFAALGTRLIAGRDFTWNDVASLRPVAIVSDGMARESWGDPRSAIGKRISVAQGPWTEVVGVVEDVHEDGVEREAPTLVYLRAGVYPPAKPGGTAAIRRGITLALRSSRAGTEGFLREISAAIHTVNPELPLAKVRTLNEVYRHSMVRTTFALVLLGIAGTMALALSIVGVYGVLAYAVARRAREISIRVALGAEPRSVRSLFLRRGLVLAGIGGVIGLFSAAALSRWISSLLFEVKPLDPVTYGAAAIAILMAAMAASYIPARRAAAVDPMETLRSE